MRPRWSTAQDQHALGDECDPYLLRTGCLWRYLPRDGFPPRSTVYDIFRKFQADGTWNTIWDHLYPMHGDLTPAEQVTVLREAAEQQEENEQTRLAAWYTRVADDIERIFDLPRR